MRPFRELHAKYDGKPQTLREALAMKPKRKYRNVPTVVDGIRFDSKAEARRYSELKMLEKVKQIRCLELQPGWALFVNAGGGPYAIGTYKADFQYEKRTAGDCDGPGWDRVVEDVKGIDTPLSKWKRKHLKAQYGIDVQLVR